MALLSIQIAVRGVFGPQESEVHFYIVGPQHEATQVDGGFEDHDFTLHYHPGKANVVADALSRKSRRVLASIASREWLLLEAMRQFELH